MRGSTWANDNGTDERVREDPRERERRRIAALRKLLEPGEDVIAHERGVRLRQLVEPKIALLPC